MSSSKTIYKKLDEELLHLAGMVDQLLMMTDQSLSTSPAERLPSAKKLLAMDTGTAIVVIKTIVAGECGVSVPEIENGNRQKVGNRWMSKRGRKCGSDARAIAMVLCGIFTEATTVEIGENFGKREHTTVSAARKKIKDLLGSGDKAFSRRYYGCYELVMNFLYEPDYQI